MDLSNIKTKITSLLSNIKLKHILILVVLVIIIEAVWAYQTIIKTNNPAVPSKIPAAIGQKKAQNIISLIASKSQFQIGEIIPVSINIESNKTTAGADLIIHYDLNLLSLAPNSSNIPVALGQIYDEYPLNQVNEKSGIIAISGITNKTGGIIPNGLFGTILFKAKAAGNAKVYLEFTKDKTNDTNIIENKNSTDILEEVKNLDLKIIP